MRGNVAVPLNIIKSFKIIYINIIYTTIHVVDAKTRRNIKYSKLFY